MRTFGFQGRNVECKDGSDEEGEKVAGVVGEQEASWLSLPILSLYINTTPIKAAAPVKANVLPSHAFNALNLTL